MNRYLLRRSGYAIEGEIANLYKVPRINNRYNFVTMKKLSKMTLVDLESKELSQRQMSQVKGGNSCGCGCCYSPPGGASSTDNGLSNCRNGQSFLPCISPYWATWGC